MTEPGARSDADIAEAILAITEVMLKPMDYPAQLVVIVPTIRDGLKELLQWRQGKTMRRYTLEMQRDDEGDVSGVMVESENGQWCRYEDGSST